MNVDALVASMSPETYQKLSEAVETGKWLDGSPITEAQRESCMQAVMIYQAKILKPDQHMTISEDGEVIYKSRRQLENEFSTSSSSSTSTIARFKKNDF